MLSKELNQYIYNNGSEDFIQQGKRIFLSAQIQIHHEDSHSLTLKVKDNQYTIYYEVVIRNYYDTKALYVHCNCVNQKRNLCKHKIAGLFYLKDLAERNLLKIHTQTYDQKETILQMLYIDLKKIKSFIPVTMVEEAEELIRQQHLKLNNTGNGVQADVSEGARLYPITLSLRADSLLSSCACEEKDYIICRHKLAVLLRIFYAYGPYYFDRFKHTDAASSKPLFQKSTIKSSVLKAQSAAASVAMLMPAKENAKMALSKLDLAELTSQLKNVQSPSVVEEIIIKEEIQVYPHFAVYLKVKGNLYEVAREGMKISRYLQNNEEKDLFKMLQKVSAKESLKAVAARFQGAGNYYTNIEAGFEKEIDQASDEFKTAHYEYLYDKLKRLQRRFFFSKTLQFQPAGHKTSWRIQCSDTYAEPVFFITTEVDKIKIAVRINIGSEWVNLDNNAFPNHYLFLYNKVLYSWQESYYEAFKLIEKWRTRPLLRSQWRQLVTKELYKIFEFYRFEIEASLATIRTETFSGSEVYVQEQDKYLTFDLFFYYQDCRVPYTKHCYLYHEGESDLTLVKRDKVREELYFKTLFDLSKQWERYFEEEHQPFRMVISKERALENKWFLVFLETMQAQKIVVKGLEALKKFTPEELKPSVKLDIQSGIDWLDVKFEVRIENEVIPLDRLQTLFKSDQSLLTLKSGKVVSVARNWLKKYRMFFELAERRAKDKLQFKKSQIHLLKVITEKEEERDYLNINWSEEARRILDKPMDVSLRLPEHLEAVVRNYQKDSFHWFQHLKKMGYNGLLGDDMGLGKTLQVLTNLAYERAKNPKFRALIVCPTSLIYIWQAEIEKFTPQISFVIHHSTQRQSNEVLAHKYNVVITTYGIVRSESALFRKINFDYIILDESQYIKNPNSKIYQSVITLQSKHKICLSGTPLQNNTFDLYAQLNFLNPNFLGSLHFFKSHFAAPIDRYDDKDMKAVLKNAIKPFFLRRTKKEVSPELPDKNISILYCEMSEKQRQVYDNCRNEFRNNLLGIVSREGIEQHRIHILQALTKLRMICNAPALVREGVTHTVSVKRDLLMEQIEGNLEEHKIIVFSQFLGMLQLLRDSLEERRICYEYLDGATKVKDREGAVRRFQEEDGCKVFLVSLKAGGVGLNLTAADYVYIVDPWWNPTIEAQAIDRTHRIGQTKKIYAQRMICKDTIEEKILYLQERKFKLSQSLIDKTDDSFLKSMTQEDLDYLLE